MSKGVAEAGGRGVALEGAAIRFGAFTAVEPTDLAIEGGSFFSILGPSGCGKTTLLRMIAGFLDPTQGRVRIGGADMAGIPPNQRPTALIFQNLALFPLMRVWENVAFGLEARGVPKTERKKRADALLDLVALKGQADKRPPELSGGQRQRVAIARALAVEPAVLLLDEPLSALDLKLRQHMRTELRAIQKRVGITFVYITHDQGEALAMSDRVAVMSQGRIEQVAPPEALYAEPLTPFVATFVGANNAVKGRDAEVRDCLARLDTPLGPLLGQAGPGLRPGDDALLFVRPERLRLEGAGVNRVLGTIERRELEGPFAQLTLRADGGQALLLHQPNTGGSLSALGERVEAGFGALDARILKAGPLAADA